MHDRNFFQGTKNEKWGKNGLKRAKAVAEKIRSDLRDFKDG